MTYAEREQIFAKEFLTVEDLMKLMDCSQSTAYQLYHRILAKSDHLCIKGKIHIADYCKFFGIDTGERYCKIICTER